MKVRLGDFIQEFSVRNRAEEDIPVYSVTNTQGFCTGYFDKDVASNDRSTYKIVPRGCFAYNPSRINVGSVDWQRHEDRVIVSPLYVVFSVSNGLLPQYLYYYLKSNVALTFIRAAATGSVRDNLKFSMLQEFSIEMKPLEEQRKVILVLDSIQQLINLYQQQLRTLDTLIKARFVEMFRGKNFPLLPLSEVLLPGSSLSYGIIVPGDYYVGGCPMIRPSDFRNDTLDLNNVYRVDPAIEQKYSRTRLIGNEILVQVIGQPGQIIPATEQCAGMNVTRNLAVIRYNPQKIDRSYLVAFLRTEQAQHLLTGGSKQSTLKQLPLGTLKAIEIIVPPIELQKIFGRIVSQINKSKAVVQVALNKAQLLFDSLMQQYFG